MITRRMLAWLVAILCTIPIPLLAETEQSTQAVVGASTIPNPIDNERCLRCHSSDKDNGGPVGESGRIFDADIFANSVHAKQPCNGCHNNVTKLPHQKPLPVVVGCVECHQKKWEEQQKAGGEPQYKRLGVVIQQINNYMDSIHAKPSMADQSRTNATCYSCHDAHNIGTIGSQQRAEHRLQDPEVCGRCHQKEKDLYLTSVHGKSLLADKNSKAAVCSDCHTTHNINPPKEEAVQLLITKNCGGCHKEELKSYRMGYHGQVNTLGYTHTAKCFDCHGGHTIQKVNDPSSSVAPANRLATCQKCHKDAPAGFLKFQPHANTHDLSNYPVMWVAAIFMNALITGVFLFFWTHLVLWFWREYQDKRAGKSYIPVTDADTVYIQRFSPVWRLLHLIFAIATMVLVFTGTTLLMSNSAWAPIVIKMLGGPQMEALIHRTAAVIWLSVLVIHLFIVFANILRAKDFQWFGPTSLIPNWQDLEDVKAMFRWFLGKAPRPIFDRWSYWQKFDYWAPFWGASIIGFTGIMLFAPTKSAMILPGSIFNVATLLHGEEAILATMFLFTVHFFNAHFRPDKFPANIVMFTGAVPVEMFKHEHQIEYDRMVATGELDKYLVKRPSKKLTTSSYVLAAILIAAGLTLLLLVITGYLRLLTSH